MITSCFDLLRALRLMAVADAPAAEAQPENEPLRLLLMPGAAGADIQHWITELQRLYPGSQRVPGGRGRSIELGEWGARLEHSMSLAPEVRWLAIAEDRAGLVLLRHLLGGRHHRVAAALLVSLPDPLRTGEATFLTSLQPGVPCAQVSLDGDAEVEASGAWCGSRGIRRLGHGPAPRETALTLAQAWIAGMRSRLAPPAPAAPARPPQAESARSAVWINT